MSLILNVGNDLSSLVSCLWLRPGACPRVAHLTQAQAELPQIREISISIDTSERRTKEQHPLKNVNSCQNTKIYLYLVTSGG